MAHNMLAMMMAFGIMMALIFIAQGIFVLAPIAYFIYLSNTYHFGVILLTAPWLYVVDKYELYDRILP